MIDEKKRRHVLKKDNYRCTHCGTGLDPDDPAWFMVEHIIPINKGGTDEVDNLASSCMQCHISLETEYFYPSLPDKLAKKWIGVFSKKPLLTGIISGFLLALVFYISIAFIFYNNDFYKNMPFLTNHSKLEKNNNKNSLALLVERKIKINKTEYQLDLLVKEKERLELIINMDRKLIKNIFLEQESRNTSSNIISFLLGIIGSLIASFLYSVVTQFWKNR